MTTLSTEMLCLRGIRNSRARFREEVLAFATKYRSDNPLDKSRKLSGEEIQRLQSDGLEQVAELLFVQDDLALHKDPARIGAFLDNHNDDMRRLVKQLTAQKLAKLDDGTTLTALRKSIFTEDRLGDLKVSARFGDAYFSQSDVGRILICLMSPETCRKCLEILGDCGFIVRVGSNAKPIRTLGIVEELYRAHLRRVVEHAAKIAVAAKQEAV